MADYSGIFKGGNALGLIRNPKLQIAYASSVAGTAAMNAYIKNTFNSSIKSVSKDSLTSQIPSALNFLIGDNILSEVAKGGYNPAVSAFIAHTVSLATTTGLNLVYDKLFPDVFSQFNLKSKIDIDVVDSTINSGKTIHTFDRKDVQTNSILSSFSKLKSIHPSQIKDIFHNTFKGEFFYNDRFLCIIESTSEYQDYYAGYINEPDYNRTYLTNLVRNITIPSVESESVTIKRYGQSLNLAGNFGMNDSININYYMDNNNVMLNKLYNYLIRQQYANTSVLPNIYLIALNPISSINKDTLLNNNLLSNLVNSLNPFQKVKNLPESKNNLLYIYKFEGVTVKNINQIIHDRDAGTEFATFPVVFNFNNVKLETEQYNFKKTEDYVTSFIYNMFQKLKV